MYDLVNYFDDCTELNTKEYRYLQGNFAPIHEENFNLPLEIVEGELPKDVQGLFLRVGANPYSKDVSRRYHWFDGVGMIHSVRIQDGTALYSNQWVETPKFQLQKKYGKPVLMQLGEIMGVVGLIKLVFLSPLILKATGITQYNASSANTAITVYGKEIYVGEEGSFPFRIKWNANNSFTNLGFETYGNKLKHPVTAHSRVDPVDGKLYFNGYEILGGKDSILSVGVDLEKGLSNYFDVNLPATSWIHDMMITENYVLHFGSSILFDMNGIWSGAFFQFNPDFKFRIGITPKNAHSSDEITWIEADEAYGLVHAMNAWEELNDLNEPEIVLWTPLSQTFDGNLKNIDNKFYMSVVRLNLRTKKMNVTLVDDSCTAEFPRVHPNFLGRKAHYGFAYQFDPSYGMFNHIIKYDLWAGTIVSKISLPEGTYMGEGIPIPKEGVSGQESDGVYISSFTFNVNTNASEWVLYDGETMNEKPVARLAVPKRVPYGFHGAWISEDDLIAHMEA